MFSHPYQSNFHFKLLPDENFLDRSKLKEIADNILKCIEGEK